MMHWNFVNRIGPSESKGLELRFLNNNISEPVYTGVPIKGAGECLKLALVDRSTGNIVKTGPEASAQVEIHAIDKSFDKTNEEGWTPDEFNAKILGGRQGKLGGNTRIQLQDGIGSVDRIVFSHTRVPLSKINVRLGAKAVNLSGEVRIREAKTESFTVKDRREMSKKDYRLSLSDKVWRLKNIRKGGPFHKILRRENINTVKDFLTEFNINPQRLQNILGKTMYTRKFMAAVNHARTSIPDVKENYFCPTVQQDAGVMLTSAGEGSCSSLEDKHASSHFPSHTNKYPSHSYTAVDLASSSRQESISDNHNEGSEMGAFDDINSSTSFEDTLSSFNHTEKADAHILVLPPFEHRDKVNVDDEAYMMHESYLLCLPTIGYSSNPPVVANSDGIKSLNADTYGNGNGQTLSNSSLDSMAQIYFEDENLQKRNPDYCHLDLDLILSSLIEQHAAFSGVWLRLVPHEKSQRRWKMVFTAVRWISLRRIVLLKQ